MQEKRIFIVVELAAFVVKWWSGDGYRIIRLLLRHKVQLLWCCIPIKYLPVEGFIHFWYWSGTEKL